MSDVSPSAIREPKQSRSRASFEKVLAAAFELLETHGYDGFTLLDVTRVSGVSIGSIYGRVSSKEDLVRAVQARVLEEVDTEQHEILSSTRWDGLTLSELLPPLIDDIGEMLRRRAKILQAFMMRAVADEVVSSVGRRSQLKLADSFVALILERRDEIAHADPQGAARACLTIGYAALSRYLGLGSSPESAGEGDWRQLKTDLALMCLCFLRFAPQALSPVDPPKAKRQVGAHV